MQPPPARFAPVRCLLVRFALVLAIGLGPVAATTAPVVPAVEGAQGAPAVQGALQAVEAELTLLLGRYASPLDGAALLGAGWRGALEAADPATGAPDTSDPGSGEAPFAPDRATAWADFVARFEALATRTGVEPGVLAQAANRSMARSVGDCHTSYAASHERELRSVDASEQYSGVGAIVADAGTFEPRPPGPVIVQVIDGGPAQRVGVRAGDAVLAVDGEGTAALSPARLVELVRGPAGSTVRLRLDRPGEAEPLEVTMQRGALDVRPVEGRLVSVPALPTPTEALLPGPDVPLPDSHLQTRPAPAGMSSGAGNAVQVGYVALREFTHSAEASLPATLDELRDAGATHWVLDLRGNRGGNLQTFHRLASLFIQSGTLAVTVDRSGAEAPLRAAGGAYRPYVQPLAVLVDGQSASAAELLAANLQEYGAARLFGTTTAGCFGTSRLFRLPDGSALWLTVGALHSGLARRNVHGVGLAPDEAVARTRADLASGHDTPLVRALAWVTRGE